MRLYSQKDVDKKALKGARIAILGYGSQGHAHALNLRDSGCDVVVGLYKGSKWWAAAEAKGLPVTTPGQAAAAAAIITVLVPDQTARGRYEGDIKANLKAGDR